MTPDVSSLLPTPPQAGNDLRASELRAESASYPHGLGAERQHTALLWGASASVAEAHFPLGQPDLHGLNTICWTSHMAGD